MVSTKQIKRSHDRLISLLMSRRLLNPSTNGYKVETSSDFGYSLYLACVTVYYTSALYLDRMWRAFPQLQFLRQQTVVHHANYTLTDDAKLDDGLG